MPSNFQSRDAKIGKPRHRSGDQLLNASYIVGRGQDSVIQSFVHMKKVQNRFHKACYKIFISE